MNGNIDPLTYKTLAPVLKDYESGEFPELFKNIPNFPTWEDMEQTLYLTEPENWSNASMFEATCVFSNSIDPVAQR